MIQQNITNFLEYKKATRNCREGTIKRYASILNRFNRFIVRINIGTENITFKSLDKFLAQVGTKNTTKNVAITCIREFSRYLATRESVADFAKDYDLLKIKDSEVTYNDLPTHEEIEQLISTATKKEKILLLLLNDTGARISEILNLTVKDFKTGKNVTEKIVGKGGRMGELLYSDVTKRNIEKYIQENKLKQKDKLIEWDYFKARYRLIELCKKCGIKYKSFHKWRYKAISDLIVAGFDLVTTQEIARHRNINTTRGYVKLAESQRKKEDVLKFVKEKTKGMKIWEE